MTAWGLKFLLVALIGLGIFFLGIGLYASDMLCLVIGALIECAALLVFTEIKKITRHPFR